MSGFTPPWFAEKFTDASGKPLSGGNVYFYIAGSTSIPKNIFLDYALTLPVSQPLVLGSDGGAEQYFMESGLYKVLWTDQFGANTQTRDNISGQGDGVSQYQVLTTAGDTTPDYLENKLAGSTTISWTTYTTGGGSILMMPSVNIDAVLDHKVLSNGLTGDSAGYLDAKLTDLIGSTFAVNGSFQVVLPFQNYGNLTGANTWTGVNTFTGHTYFTSDINTADINNAGTVYTANLQAVNITASATANLLSATVTNALTLYQQNNGLTPEVLWTNPSGVVQGSAGMPFEVAYNSGDTPGYLSTKIVPGNNVSFSTSTDVTGTTIHVNAYNAVLNGVEVLGKSWSSSGITTTGTAQSIIGMHASPVYGSFTLAANTIKIGDTYQIRVQTPQASYAWILNINLSADTGGGYSGNIIVPAGCTQVEYNITWDNITYGGNAGFYFFINTSTGLLAGSPGGYGVMDPTAAQTFTVTATTDVTASAINPYVSLWKM